MADQFAKPTFLTGVNDTLATVDTYAKTAKTTINNATSAFKNVQSNVQNALRGSKLVQDLILFKNIANDLKHLDPRTIADRLSKMSPELGKAMDTYNAIKGIGGQVQSQIAAAKGMYSRATAELNGIKAVFNPKNFESISSLTGAINQLSKNNFPLVLSDAATMIGVKSAMIQDAVSMKIPGAITALTAGVTDLSQLGGIIKGVSASVVKNCDIYALGEIANSPTCSHILVGQSPDILGDFAKGFTLPEATPASGLKAIGNTITSTFDKLDAGWKTATRGVTTVTDLTVIANGSVDFKAAVRASDSSTETDYFAGMGTSQQVSAAAAPTTAPIKSSGNSLLSSIPLGSVRQLPDGTAPVDDMFNKWQYLGERDSFAVYLNLRGFSPEYVKTKVYTMANVDWSVVAAGIIIK